MVHEDYILFFFYKTSDIMYTKYDFTMHEFIQFLTTVHFPEQISQARDSKNIRLKMKYKFLSYIFELGTSFTTRQNTRPITTTI